MILKYRPASFAALVLSLAAPMLYVGFAGAQSPASKGITGQQIYFEYACYSCHGYTGETGERVLLGSGILSSEEVFITFLRLRAEQNPLTPSARMPNYPQASLSDADARKLYTYIKTFKSNAPALENIPTFKAILDAASRP